MLLNLCFQHFLDPRSFISAGEIHIKVSEVRKQIEALLVSQFEDCFCSVRFFYVKPTFMAYIIV